MNKFIYGFDNFIHTARRWYEGVFEIDEEWKLSLWCFWDDLRQPNCKDIVQSNRFLNQ